MLTHFDHFHLLLGSGCRSDLFFYWRTLEEKAGLNLCEQYLVYMEKVEIENLKTQAELGTLEMEIAMFALEMEWKQVAKQFFDRTRKRIDRGGPQIPMLVWAHMMADLGLQCDAVQTAEQLYLDLLRKRKRRGNTLAQEAEHKVQGLLQADVASPDFDVLQSLCYLYWRADNIQSLGDVTITMLKTYSNLHWTWHYLLDMVSYSLLTRNQHDECVRYFEAVLEIVAISMCRAEALPHVVVSYLFVLLRVRRFQDGLRVLDKWEAVVIECSVSPGNGASGPLLGRVGGGAIPPLWDIHAVRAVFHLKLEQFPQAEGAIRLVLSKFPNVATLLEDAASLAEQPDKAVETATAFIRKSEDLYLTQYLDLGAEIMKGLSNHREALRRYRASLFIRMIAGGRWGVFSVPPRASIAEMFEEFGQYRRALRLRIQNVNVLAKAKQDHGSSDHKINQQYVRALLGLSICRIFTGGTEDAEKLASIALQEADEDKGISFSLVGHALRQSALAYARADRVEDASSLLKAAVELYARTMGGKDSGVAQCIEALGYVSQVDGRWREAAKRFKNAASTHQLFNDGNPECLGYARCLVSLGWAYAQIGRWRDATREAQAAADISRRICGADNVISIRALTLLSYIGWMDGHNSPELLMEMAVQSRENLCGRSNSEVIAHKVIAASLAEALEHWSQAECWWSELADRMRRLRKSGAEALRLRFEWRAQRMVGRLSTSESEMLLLEEVFSAMLSGPLKLAAAEVLEEERMLRLAGLAEMQRRQRRLTAEKLAMLKQVFFPAVLRRMLCGALC